MRSYLGLAERYEEAYGVMRRQIAGRLVLGDTDAALDKLTGFAKNIYGRGGNRLLLERSNVFDSIRNEPAFIALLDDYRKDAEEQRELLQAMNEDAS